MNEFNGNSEAKEKIFYSINKFRSYFNILLREKFRIIAINLILIVCAIVYLLFLTKPYYVCSIVILPDYGKKTSIGLSSLASLAGLNIGENPSTDIYANLIKSEIVLETVAYNKYNVDKYDHPVNLIDYFQIEANKSTIESLKERERFLILYKNILNNNISAGVDRMTKILTVDIRMPEPKLAADVANKLVESLDEYVRIKRRSSATEQRIFLEKRIEQIKDSLMIVEENLKNFVDRNRSFNLSPALTLEKERIQRDVEILNAVYIELVKQLEIIKLDEIKDAPIVNLREEAQNPIVKAGPRRLVTLIIFSLISFILTCLFFICKERLKPYIKYIMLNKEN